MKYRIISALILAALAVSFAACSNPSDTPVGTTAAVENQAQGPAEQDDTTEAKVQPDLPEKDFAGHTFTFLVKGDNFNEWANHDIAAEEENGETINDAIYKRNTYIEDKYNIKIAENRATDLAASFKKSFNAGDDTFDAMIPDLPAAATMAQSGMLYDLTKLPHIDLTKPWWDARAVEDLSVGGSLFFCVSDISYTALDTIWIMMFNKTLIKEFQLEDPYEIVKRGDWNFDKLHEMIKGVSRDLNNDGILNEEDQLGFVSPSDRYVRAMVLAANEEFFSKDKDDFFVFNNPTVNFLQAYDDTMQLMHSNNDVLDVNKIKDRGSDYLTNKYFLAKTMFEQDRVLFFSEVMQNIVRLRQMDTEFGVVPIPSFYAQAETAPQYVFVDTTTAVAIPSNSADPERASIIIEAMAAESHYTVLPAYYDVSLKTKLARDTQSGEMMDLIRANRSYDLTSIYNFGTMYGTTGSAIIANKVSYQTTIDKLSSKIEIDLEKKKTAYQEVIAAQ